MNSWQALTFNESVATTFSFLKSITIGCFLFGQFLTNSLKAAESEPLHIQPQICVSDQQNYCELDLQLNWENISQSYVCILSDHAQYPRWCNSIKDQKSTVFQLKTQHDVHFTLINPDDDKVISEAILKVSVKKETSTRHRYRNPWSLF